MKKKILAAGLASAAIAAMPVVGVFAEPQVSDTVVVTVSASCTLSSTAGGSGSQSGNNNTYSENMEVGTLKYTGGTGEEAGFGSATGATEIGIKCNDLGGWRLDATGTSSETAGEENLMIATGTGTNIATSTTTGGSNPSSWAFKVTGDSGVIVSGKDSFHAVPGSTAETVATKSTHQGTATVKTGYQVWIGNNQEADTYTGQVTYTLYNPAA